MKTFEEWVESVGLTLAPLYGKQVWNAAQSELLAENARLREVLSLISKGSRGGFYSIRDYKEAAQQSGWMPIESAPKDGTEIVIACYGECPRVVWCADQWDGCWKRQDMDGDVFINPRNIHYWIPTPPTGEHNDNR